MNSRYEPISTCNITTVIGASGLKEVKTRRLLFAASLLTVSGMLVIVVQLLVDMVLSHIGKVAASFCCQLLLLFVAEDGTLRIVTSVAFCPIYSFKKAELLPIMLPPAGNNCTNITQCLLGDNFKREGNTVMRRGRYSMKIVNLGGEGVKGCSTLIRIRELLLPTSETLNPALAYKCRCAAEMNDISGI